MVSIPHRVRVFRDLLWEPIWEPIALDGCGRLWTPVDWEALCPGLCGRLWTCVDTACRSTDQEVGDSSSSGRASEAPVFAGASSLDGLVDLLTFGSHSREPSVVCSTIQPTNHVAKGERL